MNTEQYTRYARFLKEVYYLLDTHRINNKLTFFISGSTKNVYSIIISNSNIKCDCPDFSKCYKKYVCKHCLFILIRVLRVFNINDKFFTTFYLNDQDMEKILNTFMNIISTTPHTNQALTDKYKSMCLPISSSQPPKSIDDVCGICYDNMTIKQNLKSCKLCKKSIHKECLDRWLTANNKTCVYCRQLVYTTSTSSISSTSNTTNTNYINLS